MSGNYKIYVQSSKNVPNLQTHTPATYPTPLDPPQTSKHHIPTQKSHQNTGHCGKEWKGKSQSPPKFRIVSFNVRGAGDKIKREKIFAHHRPNADILIMLESHSSKDTENIWENEWGGKAIYAHGTTAARGIAIFATREIYQKISNIYKDEDGRVIILDITDNKQQITVAAIYAPNQDSPNFFQNLKKNLKERSEHKVIIGDYNLTLNVEMDRLNTYNNNNKAKEEVENMMEEFCLKDVWRNQNEHTRQYSLDKKRELTKSK